MKHINVDFCKIHIICLSRSECQTNSNIISVVWICINFCTSPCAIKPYYLLLLSVSGSTRWLPEEDQPWKSCTYVREHSWFSCSFERLVWNLQYRGDLSFSCIRAYWLLHCSLHSFLEIRKVTIEIKEKDHVLRQPYWTFWSFPLGS